MKAKPIIDKSKLQPVTFWDVNFKEFEPNEHKAFVINRLAHRASIQEFFYLLKTFTYQEIFDILDNCKGVDKVVLNFYKQMANASSN